MTWKLKRNDTQATVTLPEDLQWQDEFGWSKIAQSTPKRGLGGSNFIFEGIRKGGRPITLSGDWVWINRGDIVTLRDWTDVPKLEMTLTHYNGTEYQVKWRLHDNPAIIAEPVHYETPETDKARYKATFKLITITI